MFQKRPNMAKELASALSENPVWTDLAATVSDVINEVISEPRWALARIREAEIVQRGDWVDTPVGIGQVTLYRRVRSNIDQVANTYDFEDFVEVQVEGKGYVTLPVRVLHDRETLINGSRNLGFNYFSKDLQDDDYARIMRYVGQFWKHNGADHFVDFMGLIKRTRFTMTQLWTEDIGDPGLPSFGTTPANQFDHYANLFSQSEYLPKIWNRMDFDPSLTKDQGLAGAYYPTSHVELGYDMIDHPMTDDQKLDVLSLFYLLAPIHLVMSRFVETIYTEVDVSLNVAPMLYTIQQRSIKIEL